MTTLYKHVKYHEWLNNVFNHMINQTYTQIQNEEINKIDPDLLDDFFGLITRYFRYLPEVVLRSPSLETQLKLGVKTIGVTTSNAARALYQFHEEVFMQLDPSNQNKNIEVLARLIAGGYGAVTVNKMIEVLWKKYPERKLIDFMDDVFKQILLHVREVSINWWVAALMDVPQQILNNGEKASFVENLKTKSYKENEDYYKDFFEKFYKRCRTYSSKLF